MAKKDFWKTVSNYMSFKLMLVLLILLFLVLAFIWKAIFGQ